MLQRKSSPWQIEIIFRDSKQYTGLGASQRWVDRAMACHVAFVWLTFVVLQMLRRNAREPIASVKECYQVAMAQNCELWPPPFKTYPPELRTTNPII